MNHFFRGEYVNITVRNARTHIEEGRARFTDYEVEVKTNHISFTVKQSKVRRRYSDFVWLRDRLTKDLMTSDTPSLPGRKLFGRFNTDFIRQRQRRLQDFLSKVVKNNVFLSNAALHLFLQSKMTIEEIEEYIDSKNDENTCDTILSESAFKEANEAIKTTRDRLPSKPDSGIESSGHDDVDNGDLDSAQNDNGEQEEEVLTDGNAADSEDNAEYENEASDNNNTDDDQLQSDFRKLRLSSLPCLGPEDEDELESSVEFLLRRESSESENDVIEEDNEVDTENTKESTRKLSTSSNKSPRKFLNRSRRRRRTCIAQFTLQQASKSKEEVRSISSPTLFRKRKPIRRCYSFDKCTRPFPMFEMKNRSSLPASRHSDYELHSGKTSKSSLYRSTSSKISGSDERHRSRFSGSEERFRSPVKRKISLNEYHIVKKDACFHVSLDEKDFNSSF